MLIIDEIHHLLAGGSEKHRHFLHVLKYFANELQIPIIGVGTIDALRTIQTDEQLENRFEALPLPSWQLDRDFQRLLASFERTLPLHEPSGLSNERLAAQLLALSQVTIGELAALLTRAATYTIETGREQIDEHVLTTIDWVPPSQRRQRAVRIV